MKNKDWESVYGRTLSIPSYEYTVRQGSLGSGNIYIFGCQFSNCKATGCHGGALCVSSSSPAKMLIEKSFFLNCQVVTSGYKGGGLFFSNAGSCVLSEVCGYGCCTTTTTNWQFDYVYCQNKVDNMNYANDSTITHSINKNSAYSMGHYCGIIIFNGVNCSYNKCIYYNACYFEPVESTNDLPITCIIVLCSFAYNIASNGAIVCTGNQGSKKIMKTCNVIKNEQVPYSQSSGIIHSYGNLDVTNSCILENSAKLIFSETIDSYILTVSNCTLELDIETKIGSYVTIKSNASRSFIHAIVHISSGSCEAQFDSVENLNVKVNASKKTRKICLTQNNINKINQKILTYAFISIIPTQ